MIILHSEQYRFFKKNHLVLLSCNPRRIILGLHGKSTEELLLTNLYCQYIDMTLWQLGVDTQYAGMYIGFPAELYDTGEHVIN